MKVSYVHRSRPPSTLVISGTIEHIIIRDTGGFQSRHKSTVSLILEALRSGASEIGNRSFVIPVFTGDRPSDAPRVDRVPTLCYSVCPKSASYAKPIPDFGFDSWPEAGIDQYGQLCDALFRAGMEPPQIEKVFWIGNLDVHRSRRDLYTAVKGHSHIEMVSMEWLAGPVGSVLPATRYVSPVDHCKYRAVFDIRGKGYSGRLKTLFWMRRAVFKLQDEFKQYFMQDLIPDVHYILARDAREFIDRSAAIMKDHVFMEQLAKNAGDFARRHLTRDCAIQRLKETIINYCLRDAGAAKGIARRWVAQDFGRRVSQRLGRMLAKAD